MPVHVLKLAAFSSAALLGAGGETLDPGLAQDDQGPLPSLVWLAPLLAGGGYSSEALSYTLQLEKEYAIRGGSRLGVRQFAEHEHFHFTKGLPKVSLKAVQRLAQAGRVAGPWDVAVCHATPDVWHEDGAFGWGSVQPCPPRGARLAVGRTMYETDRLPEEWVPRINKMDQVWVPTPFAAEQFAASGVHRDKIAVVPEAVDVELFDPDKHKPHRLPAAADVREGDFRFLSVFKWEARKGWDVLLRAYFEEFSAEDPVFLVIKTQPFHSDSNFEEKITAFAETLPAALKPLARYAVLTDNLSLKTLPRLYKVADAFVLPSRGEGWGRPHVEAMSMGLPVIATNWSGPTAFLTEDTGLPLRIDGLSAVGEGLPAGHLWAEPSLGHLRQLLRWTVEHRDEAARLGQRAREHMAKNFSPVVIVRKHVLPLLRLAQKPQQRDRLELF